MKLRNVAIFLVLTLSACALEAQSAQTLGPGNMRLLPGYVHTPIRPLDSAAAGRISKPHGLVVSYDIGGAAGHYEEAPDWKNRAAWRTEQVIDGKRVVCIYAKSKELLIAFPDDLANFHAKARTQRDITDMMLMVLTYDPK
jgi:hypothetical protein